ALIRRLVTGLATVALDHHAAQVVGGEDQRGADRLAGRRLVLARQRAAETAAIQADAHAATLRLALDGAHEVDFTGGRVHDTDIDRDVGLALLATQRDALEGNAATAAGGAFLVGRHGAHHQVLRAGQLADARAGGRGNPARSAQVLLGQH